MKRLKSIEETFKLNTSHRRSTTLQFHSLTQCPALWMTEWVMYWRYCTEHFFFKLKKERKEKRKNSFRAGGVINWQIKSQGIKRKEHLFFCVCVPWRARISIRRERARAPQWRWPKITRQVSDAAKKTSSYFAYERKERKKNKKALTPIR